MDIKGNVEVQYLSITNAYLADSGTTNAFAVTIDPAVTAYVAGLKVIFKAANANTGAATLNVNGLGTKTIKKNVSVDLASGDIIANQIVTVIYDGTNFQTGGVASGSSGGGGGTSYIGRDYAQQRGFFCQ